MHRTHRDVAGEHRQRADDDRVAQADPTVGKHAAEQWREIHHACVQAEQLRRECLRREWTGDRFHRRAQLRKADDVFDMAREQQLVDHVQHDQRRHAVVRESLPGFRERQEVQSFRMAE
jgi:hypothetical protein